jgi:hypothetical protein
MPQDGMSFTFPPRAPVSGWITKTFTNSLFAIPASSKATLFLSRRDAACR